LSERLGQSFIIENRPGGGNNIGTEVVVRSSPDGYTLLMMSTTNAINATLYEKLNYNFIRDLVAVAAIASTPNILVTNPSVPAKTALEFIGHAKSHPGKINMASAGIGHVSHVFGELFKIMAGVDMVHVPYRGVGPALTDMLSGQVQVMFASPAATIEHFSTGKLRALAITSAIRSGALPDIPTVGEFVPGYEASAFIGLGAPKNTPSGIIDTLNKQINAALADPKIRARLAELDGEALALSPANFGKLIADETEKWAKVIRIANIKSE